MNNDKFSKLQSVELLKGCSDAPHQDIPKGSIGVITNVYKTGDIRIANKTGKNYKWEIYLHRSFIFSDTIKPVESE